ncbi:MAG: phosphatidate cytidylyltransferase [Porticoccaceae bacterium]
MLKQRVITALILLALLLGALFGLAAPMFAVFAGAVILLGFREWAALSALGRGGTAVYLAGVSVLMVVAFEALGFSRAQVHEDLVSLVLLGTCQWWILALLCVWGYPASAALWGSKAVRALMGVLVLLPPWIAISWLVSLETGRWLVVLTILTVACADTGAYFCGRALGRHKLAPRVSPGKTLEGMAGGVLLALIVVPAVVAFSAGQRHLWPQWAVVVLVTVLAAVLGDLLESMVKRHRGVKDSGNILPGHGGLLDRVDSLTAALPVFSLMYLLLIHLRT